MKYLLIGHRGFIGTQLLARLREAGQEVAVVAGRLASADAVRAAVRQAQPDRVVLAAGLTHTRECATIDALEAPDAWPELVQANLLLPLWVAEATAAKAGKAPATPVLYIGTGCIFAYDAAHAVGGAGFTEEDVPNYFGSAYSRVKGATDTLLRSHGHVLNARIRMPIAPEDGPRDFVTKLHGYARIACVPNSMTVCADVLPALLALVHTGVGGTFNAANPGALDHAAVLDIFAAATGRAHAYERVSQGELEAGLRAGRSNNTLATGKLEAAVAALPEATRALYGCPARIPPLAEGARVAAKLRAPMRLLVTGGLGFIGSGFINACLRTPGARVAAVVNVDSLEPCAREDNVVVPVAAKAADAAAVAAADAPTYTWLRLDIGTEGAETRLADALAAHAITHVVHFAARSHVDTSFDGDEALRYTITNVLGTHRLAEATRRYVAAAGGLAASPFVQFLHISTDECVGTVADGAATEDAPLCPSNPYAASKAGAEYVVRSYGLSFGMPWKMTRLNNVYGPQQYVEKCIPRFAELVARGEPLTLHGGGVATRKFLHLRDAVAAIWTVLVRGRMQQIYHVGADVEISVRDLAGRVLEHARRVLPPQRLPPAPGVVIVADRPFQDLRYSCDDTKLRRLGWAPRVPFDDGLGATLEAAWAGMGVGVPMAPERRCEEADCLPTLDAN